MAESNDDLARALEAMSSGHGDARAQEQAQADIPPVESKVSAEHGPRAQAGSASSAPASQRKPAPDHGLFLRQTAIPPLLTLGMLMPLAGIASLVLGEESPLGAQVLVPALLMLVGLLLLGVAVLNMLQVRQLLSASAQR